MTKRFFIKSAACAVIPFASMAAFAQITPYAKVDLAVANKTVTDTPDKGLQIVGNGYASSVFGVKGASNIGDGLKASAQLEVGFNPNSPAGFTAGAQNRVAKVVLEGGFGAVQLGTDWSPFDNANNDAMDHQNFSSNFIGGAWSHGVHDDNGNNASDYVAHNHIQYTTPTVSGFNAVVMYAPAKTATSATSNIDTSYNSFGLNYANGPVVVSFGTEHVPTSNSAFSTTIAGNAFTDAWVLTGSYNLGAFAIFAGMEEAKAAFEGTRKANATDRGYSVGVKVPMGALTLSAGVARETTTSSDAADTKATSYSAQALYALNKIAMVYVAARNYVENDTGKDIAINKVAAGMRFVF